MPSCTLPRFILKSVFYKYKGWLPNKMLNLNEYSCISSLFRSETFCSQWSSELHTVIRREEFLQIQAHLLTLLNAREVCTCHKTTSKVRLNRQALTFNSVPHIQGRVGLEQDRTVKYTTARVRVEVVTGVHREVDHREQTTSSDVALFSFASDTN